MKNLKSILGVLAPTLGTALGGPLGGMAARALSEALLGKPDGSIDDLEEVIGLASPDQLANIKKIEADFKVQLKALDVDIAKINADEL